MRRGFISLLACIMLLPMALLHTSCEKDASSAVIMVECDNLDVVETGRLIQFRIHAFSSKKTSVERVVVFTVDNVQGKVVLLDTLVNSKDFKHDYVYTVPERPDGTGMKITFQAVANDKETSETSRKFTVSNEATPLVSLDAITLFSALSSQPNGYSIALEQTVHCETTSEEYVDIYDASFNIFNPTDTFSREWQSMTGLQFALFNDFNFATATAENVNAAYAGASKYSEVRNIQDNDIILIGRGEEAIGVIKIIAVIDVEGTENDRYVFNLKLIRRS